eukprot:COSAG06_NODE_2268_length_7202_cov_2.299592_6_plen_478_part_00
MEAAAAAPPRAESFLIREADVSLEAGNDGIIGRGALGEVRRGILRSTGARMAFKELLMLRTDEASVRAMGVMLTPAERAHVVASFKAEAEMLRGLRHEHIVPFVGVVVSAANNEWLHIVTPYFADGTLQDLLYLPKYERLRTRTSAVGAARSLPLRDQLVAGEGLFSALEYLASRRMVHRDVKPANILIVLSRVVANGGAQRLSKVALTDFGESKGLEGLTTRGRAATAAGTPLYAAPEMADDQEQKGPSADVFSAGVVLLEMSTGRRPQPGPQHSRDAATGRRCVVPEEERRRADLDAARHPQIGDMARRCVVDEGRNRATAAEIVVQCREHRRVLEAPPPRAALPPAPAPMPTAAGELQTQAELADLRRRLEDRKKTAAMVRDMGEDASSVERQVADLSQQLQQRTAAQPGLPPAGPPEGVPPARAPPAELMAMGFPEWRCRIAFGVTGHSVDQAVDMLLSHQRGQEEAPAGAPA